MESICVGSWMSEPQANADVGWKPHPWLQSTIMGEKSDTGLRITPEAALTHTPLWHGLTLLGGDIGSLEMEQKRVNGEIKTKVTTHNAYKLTGVRPNSLMCPAEFWESQLIRAILWGNAICEIPRDNAGRPLAVEDGGGLRPLPPDTTTPDFDESGKLWIKTRIPLPDGSQRTRMIDPADTFHLANVATDGFWGRALVEVAKNRIGNGLGLEKQHNRFMLNGMQPDWMFVFPEPLSVEDRDHYEDFLRKRNKGLANTGQSLMFDQGVNATQLGMTFEHAQFLELVKMDVQMTASLLGIPAVMLNLMEQMTFSNAEESERWYINRTLRRWCNKIEQESSAKLLTMRERERYTFEFNLRPLLRGRLEERYEAYQRGVAARILSPNDCRMEEGLNPYEGGDEYENPNITPGNSMPALDQRMAADQLKAILKKEDYDVSEACRRESNILDWLDTYYHQELLTKLFQVAPNSAGYYCEGRFRLWRKTSDHVSDAKSLGGIVKAQGQTVADRVSGLLNAEFCNASSD
jgi:HK97 family phage portal protein